MKATGIVRRMDELGRIVIPMEIRKIYGINDRDPLEIFTDDERHIIIKKYEPLPEISGHIDILRELIHECTNYSTDVTKIAISLLVQLEKLLIEAV